MAVNVNWSMEDLEAIRVVVREVLQQPIEIRGRPPSVVGHCGADDIPPAPDYYIVRTPSGGIGATTTATGTGSDIGGDTGTGQDTAYMVSYADCTVYQILTIPPRNIDELVSMGFTIRVYNYSPLDVAGDTFVGAFRDKLGVWSIPWPGFPVEQCP